MAMNLSDKSIPTFESEMNVDEQTFFWKIKNFAEVIQSDSLIHWQTLDFHAGDNVLLSSDWTMFLVCVTKDGGNWVGIFYKVKEKPSASCTELLTQCQVAIKNKKGKTVWDRKLSVKDAFNIGRGGWGFDKMIKRGSPLPFLVDGSLVIHVNFKIYSEPNPKLSVETALKEFQTQARAKAWKDIEEVGLLTNPVPCNETIKLVSSDGEEFTAQKAVLAARNPVFKAILESNMAEGNSGVIHFPNISSATLQVLIPFLCQGNLPPDWSHPQVIVELTNAAAQYQIDDLLEFLDSMLGSVCTLENVVELLALAIQLPLNTAKKDLMRYVKQKGFGSLENLVEFLKSLSVGDSSDTGPNPSSKKRSLTDGDEGKRTAGKKAKTDT